MNAFKYVNAVLVLLVLVINATVATPALCFGASNVRKLKLILFGVSSVDLNGRVCS